MKLRYLAVIVVAILGFLAFARLDGVAGADEELMIILDTQNNSGETGTVEFHDQGDGTTHVMISIQGAPAGVEQPAHIHEGTCANLNATPKYPLTTVVAGKSETMVDVPLSELMGKPYAVNVHKSGQESQVYVACGNIVATGGMPTALPHSGGGGMAEHSLPWLPLTGSALLVLTALGAGYTRSRRRA